MHICMLIPSYQGESAFQSGAALQAYTQIKFLQSRGYTVSVITKKRSKKSRCQEVRDGVAIYRVAPVGLRSMKAAWLIWRHRRQISVVHVHGQHIFGAPAIFLCHMLGIPTVLKITIAGQTTSPLGLDKILPRGWHPCRAMVNGISRLVAAYLAISSEIVAELTAQGVAPGKIVFLPNGVDTKRFCQTAAAQKQQLRVRLQLPQNKKIVLFASRLIERKGYDTMLAAWRIIHRDHPEAALLVVGKGNDGAIAALKNLQQESGGETVAYKGEVPDTTPYLQASDLFVFPSRQEGLPNALLEAMACGCACVASDIGGCRDLIADGENGLLFPSGDAAALADRVDKLLTEPVKLQKFGEAAYDSVKEKYDIVVVGEQLTRLYGKLTAKGRYSVG